MKNLKRVLSLVFAILLAASLLTACGSSKRSEEVKAVMNQLTSTDAAADVKPEGKAGEAKGNGKFGDAMQKEQPGKPQDQKSSVAATAVTGTGTPGEAIPNAVLSQRKIIRNANVTVEVEDFDIAYGKIKSMISGFGFVQESSIKKDKIYIDSKEKLITKGIIIVRIDKDKFERILSDVKGLGLLLNENIKSDDVTDKFFDTESSLRLLRFEQSRLEQYLQKANDPDTIFKTESRLTQIRQDIERLTGTLQKWNDLVELSTITINMNEKIPDTVQQAKEKSYLGKLSESFTGSFKGVVVFCGNLLIFIVQALPILALLGLIAYLAFIIYRKFIKGKIKNSDKKDQEPGM